MEKVINHNNQDEVEINKDEVLVKKVSSFFDINHYDFPEQETLKLNTFQEFFVNDNNKNRKIYKYKNNEINTSKYNIFTFLPKGILYQFLKLNNFYFLTIAALQLTTLSPISPLTTAAFAFVIVFSLIREGFEDLVRHKYDDCVNKEKCFVYKNNKWTEILSKELNMGDIVLVKNGCSFTSDLMLLDSNLKDGICYIETCNLDGERNAKLKISNVHTHGLFKEFAIKANIGIQCENLNRISKHKNMENNEEYFTKSSVHNNKVEVKIKKESVARVEDFSNKKIYDDLKYNNNNQTQKNEKQIDGDILLQNYVPENYYNLEFIQNFSISGIVLCNKPNPSLYELTGKLKLKFEREGYDLEKEFICDIDKNQLLLKGAILRNCKWIIGIVLYTGMKTKIMLNSNKPSIKFSKIDNILARLIIMIFFIQAVFCIVSAGLNSYYYNEVVLFQKHLPKSSNQPLDSFLIYFTYMVLLNTMIPITLIITIELVKVTLSIFIKSDVLMYSNLRHKFPTTGTVSLMDEIGMVDYIFTDKTGTLTLNKMDFRYCIIGNSCYKYNKDENEIKTKDQQEEKNEFDNSLLIEENFMKAKTIRFGKNYFNEFKMLEDSQKISFPNYRISTKSDNNVEIILENKASLSEEFWKAIALCHECIINENNEITGASQDDIELVRTAMSQGYNLLQSEDSKIIKLEINQKIQNFQVIKMIEFSSSRKRASILVKDGDFYKLFIKGADSEIIKRLGAESMEDFKSSCSKYVDYFSSLGYRTLFVGMKLISKDEAETFEKRIKDSEKLSTKNKEKYLDDYYNKIEKDFHLLGAVVQEDKLQDQVPSTIRDLRLANIKTWMLSGDKIETAISISKSCHLLPVDNDQNLLIVLNKETFKQEMNKLLKKTSLNSMDQKLMKKNEFYLAISGDAITEIFSDNECKPLFEYVSKNASSVICARFSPKQKADIVKKMKEIHPNKIMLSIGDGGNDVSMILEAHIGVGVFGEEGSQAVQASDFAIGEFKMLRRLLLNHGRINHIRISQMIKYFLFKNYFFTIIQFYYGFFNNFSGQPALDEWFITLYNIFFTAFPLVARALFDHDIKSEDGTIVEKMLPFLYRENRDHSSFSKKKLLLSILRGFLYGIFMYFFTLYTMLPDSINSLGYIADHFVMSCVMFSNIYHGVSMRVLLLQRYITIYSVLVFIFCSYFFFIFYISIMEKVAGFKSTGAIFVAFSSGRSYLNMIFVIVTVSLCDLFTYSYEMNFINTLTNLLSKARKNFGKLEDESKMPFEIRACLKAYNEIEDKLLLEHEHSDLNNNKINIEKTKTLHAIIPQLNDQKIIIGKKTQVFDVEKQSILNSNENDFEYNYNCLNLVENRAEMQAKNYN